MAEHLSVIDTMTGASAAVRCCPTRARRSSRTPAFVRLRVPLHSGAARPRVARDGDSWDRAGAAQALPGALFGPLDLRDAIDEAERTQGAHAVVSLLATALTDRRVRRDTEIDGYLEKLKSACRQTRRYREAIAVFERIAELNPARRHEVAAELALVWAHLGEPAKGLALLESAFAEQRRLPARRRSLEFCLVAELAATVLRHPTMAREVAALGRAAAQARPVVRTAQPEWLVAVR